MAKKIFKLRPEYISDFNYGDYVFFILSRKKGAKKWLFREVTSDSGMAFSYVEYYNKNSKVQEYKAIKVVDVTYEDVDFKESD